MFMDSKDAIQDFHGRLFTKFGAAIVSNFEPDTFHLKVPLIDFETGFDECGVELLNLEWGKVLLINHKKENILILGANYYLTAGGAILGKQVNVTLQLMEALKSYGVKKMFFSKFGDSSHLYL